jgi:PAS domain S-box-containing protein
MDKSAPKQTPLHRAIAEGQWDKVARLLERNADINARSETGATPLHVAVEQGRATMVQLLLSNGANARTPDHRGYTPLHLAAFLGYAEIAADLILEVTDLADVPDSAGRTALHLAAAQGHADVVDILVKHGATLDAHDHVGRTPLHDAAAHDQPESVDLLLVAGADVNATDHFQHTPLHLAALQGCAEIVELLLTKHAVVNARDHFGCTALCEAALKGQVDVASVLLQYGADITATDHLGQTPLYLAVVHAHQEMITFLKKHLPADAREQATTAPRTPQGPATLAMHSEDEYLRIAAQVQQQTRMFEELLAALPDHVYLFDVQGMVRYINPGAARFWGTPQSEWIGQSWHALAVPAEHWAPLRTHSAIVVAGGAAINSEIVWPMRQGSRYFAYVLFPLHRADGAVSMVVCVARDITARKQVEMALQDVNAQLETRVAERAAALQAELAERQRVEVELYASTERFRLLADASFEGIVISEQGTILEANAQFARIVGYPVDALIGISVVELVISDDRAMVQEYLATGYESPYMCRALRKDGSTVPIAVHGRMLPYHDRLVRVTAIQEMTDQQADSAQRQRP